MNNAERIMNELGSDNQRLRNEIVMLKATVRDLEKSNKKLLTTFEQLLEIWEQYRISLGYDSEQTQEIRYQLIENAGILDL